MNREFNKLGLLNHSNYFYLGVFITCFFLLSRLGISSNSLDNATEGYVRIILIFSFLCFVLDAIKTNNLMIPFPYLWFTLLLFSIYQLIIFSFSPSYELGTDHVGSWLLMPLYLFVCLQVCRYYWSTYLLLVCVFYEAVFQALYGLYQTYYFLPSLATQFKKEPNAFSEVFRGVSNDLVLNRLNSSLPYGSFYSPNSLSVLMIVGFIVCVLMIWLFRGHLSSISLKIKSGLFALIGLCIFLFVFVLYLTDSKGAWIAFCLSIPTMIFLIYMKDYGWYKKRKFYPICFVLAFSFVTLFFFLIKMQPDLFLSFKVRWDYWMTGLQILMNEGGYLFGNGVGAFSYYYTQYKVDGAWEVREPHSLILSILVESGFVGLFLFLSFLFLLGKSLLFSKDKFKGEDVEEVLELLILQKNWTKILITLILIILALLVIDVENISLLSPLIILVSVFLYRRFKGDWLIALNWENKLGYQLLIALIVGFQVFSSLPRIFGSYIFIPDMSLRDNPIFLLLAFLTSSMLAFLFYLLLNSYKNNYMICKKFPIIGLFTLICFFIHNAADINFKVPGIVILLITVCIVGVHNHIRSNDICLKFKNEKMRSLFVLFIFCYVLFSFYSFVKPNFEIASASGVVLLEPKDSELQKKKIENLEELARKFSWYSKYPLTLFMEYNKLAYQAALKNNKEKEFYFRKKAYENIEKAISANGSVASWHLHKARTLYSLKASAFDIEKAYKKAIQVYPLKAIYYLEFEIYLKTQKRHKEAIANINKSISLHLETNDYRTKLSSEKYKDALEMMEEYDNK